FDHHVAGHASNPWLTVKVASGPPAAVLTGSGDGNDGCVLGASMRLASSIGHPHARSRREPRPGPAPRVLGRSPAGEPPAHASARGPTWSGSRAEARSVRTRSSKGSWGRP